MEWIKQTLEEACYLESLALGSDKLQQKIVEHGGHSVHHGGVAEEAADLRGEHLQRVDRLAAQNVVEPAHNVILDVGATLLEGKPNHGYDLLKGTSFFVTFIKN